MESSSSDSIFMAADVITCVLGITGNGVVIWIAGFKMKKSVSTIWFLSLAVADFLYCSIMPFNFVYFLKNWLFGKRICKFKYFFTTLNLYSSVFLLVIISIDRCVVVKFPVWVQNKRNTTKASGIVLLFWIISASISSPDIIFSDTVSLDNQTLCVIKPEGEQNFVASSLFKFIVGFLIPFLIISVCYLVIIRKVVNQQYKKPLKVIIMVISAFFVCWMPFHIVALIRIHSCKNIPFVVRALVVALVKANSFLNPFLYAFMGKDFKKQCCMSLANIQRAIED